jgi:hypothetical protein
MTEKSNDIIGALMAKALEHIGDEALRTQLIDEARLKLELPVEIGRVPGGRAVMIPAYIAVIWRGIEQDLRKEMGDALKLQIPAASHAAVKAVLESDASMLEIRNKIIEGALDHISTEVGNRLANTIGHQLGYTMAEAFRAAMIR